MQFVDWELHQFKTWHDPNKQSHIAMNKRTIIPALCVWCIVIVHIRREFRVIISYRPNPKWLHAIKAFWKRSLTGLGNLSNPAQIPNVKLKFTENKI